MPAGASDVSCGSAPAGASWSRSVNRCSPPTGTCTALVVSSTVMCRPHAANDTAASTTPSFCISSLSTRGVPLAEPRRGTQTAALSVAESLGDLGLDGGKERGEREEVLQREGL